MMPVGGAETGTAQWLLGTGLLDSGKTSAFLSLWRFWLLLLVAGGTEPVMIAAAMFLSISIATGPAQHFLCFPNPAQRRHIPPSIPVSRPLLLHLRAAAAAWSPAAKELLDNEPPQSGSRCPTAAADAVFHASGRLAGQLGYCRGTAKEPKAPPTLDLIARSNRNLSLSLIRRILGSSHRPQADLRSAPGANLIILPLLHPLLWL